MNTSMRRARMRLKGTLVHAPYAVIDAVRNRRCRGIERRFLVLRHSAKNPHFHDYLLNWLESELPSVRAYFEQRLLPAYGLDLSRYLVCAPWLQDPAKDWLPLGSWNRLQRIELLCAKRGIPVINPSQNLSRATKSTGSRIMGRLGIRTPRILPVTDPASFQRDRQGLSFPLIIREDRKHAAPTYLVMKAAELAEVPWSRMACPVASEYIDVRNPDDGLYRKYRYVAARDFGVPRHLIVSRHWEVHAACREHNRIVEREEIDYLERSDPNHEALQRVRRALRLDLVAFDYSYAPDGQLVVWEANPYPNLSYPTGPGTKYTTPYVNRSFAAIAAMYLTLGQLELHPRIVELLGECVPNNVGDAA